MSAPPRSYCYHCHCYISTVIVIAVVTIIAIAIAIAIVSIIDVAVVGVFCRPRQKLKGRLNQACRRQLWPHFCVTKAKLQLEWLDLASAKVISSLMASLQAGSWLGEEESSCYCLALPSPQALTAAAAASRSQLS